MLTYGTIIRKKFAIVTNFISDSFIMDPVRFYAESIDYSLGRFTRELLLMRVVLITSETNLVEVQQIYPEVDCNKLPLLDVLNVSTCVYTL